MTSRTRLAIIPVLILALSSLLSAKPTQSRDHLTPEEQELIREAQILDKRIDVFIKAVNRRLMVLKVASDQSTSKQQKKDAEKWGELPVGSPSELVRDIAKILDEAITNIDDVSAHDERNPLIAKALRKLASETTRVVEQLKPLQAQATGDAEHASFEELIDNAESILQAANKLPPPVEKKEKGKGEKNKTSN